MKTTILSGSIVFLAVAIFLSVLLFNSQPAVGSVQHGGEYQASYITSTDANSTSSLRTLSGTVGQVVVTEDGTGGAIDFYNQASSTAATSSADLLFSVDGAAAEGTYVYDVAFGTGLLIDVNTGFDGQVTITYR